jgi:putative FmdB family regulatory protein
MFRIRPPSLSFDSMPTYDYRCPNGHDFEHFYRKISEADAELTCPVCGAVAARRVSGGAGLLFKGSGFYLTDYGKNAHRKSAPEKSGESKGESTSGSGDGAKSESTTSTGKTDASAGAKSETKSAEPKPSSKPKGGDSK